MEPALAETLLDADGEAMQEKWLVELDAEEALIEAAPAEAEGEARHSMRASACRPHQRLRRTGLRPARL
jgi:hypothetical protein